MKTKVKIINKMLVAGSELRQLGSLMDIGKSTCKIKTNCGSGSGFLIKLYKDEKPFYCLMTNQHVLEKEKNEIEVFYDNLKKKLKIKLDGSDKRFIRDYKYINLDLIIIEILSQDMVDKVEDKVIFLMIKIFYLQSVIMMMRVDMKII